MLLFYHGPTLSPSVSCARRNALLTKQTLLQRDFAVPTCPSIFQRDGEATLVVVEPTDGRERCRVPHPSFFSVFFVCFVLFVYNVLFRVACSRSALSLNFPTPRWNDAHRRRTDRWSREIFWSSPAIVLCFCVSFPFIILLFRVFNFGSRVHGSRSLSTPWRHGETTIHRRWTGRRTEEGAEVCAHRICHAI